MIIEAGATDVELTSVDAVAQFVATDGERAVAGRDLANLGQRAEIDLTAALGALRMTGKAGDVARLPIRLGDRTVLLLVAGVGDADDVDAHAVRRAAAAASRQAGASSTMAVVVPDDLPGGLDGETLARAVAVGAGVGAYVYTAYRTDLEDVTQLDRIVVVAGDGVDADAVARGAAWGRRVAAATNTTRDLVNTPPAFKRPPALADHVTELVASTPITAKVLGQDELVDGGFGGLVGVARGSSAEPRLVELTYPGSGATDEHVVLVGKGITFDSGGLSIKSSSGMATMKSDMSGAASIVGAMLAAAELELAPRVTGLLALAENMPGGDATRVSDVLTHRDGTTVEVMNTDAEGRLVLADALAYGRELEPSAMIDLATLTGAQITALGKRIAAVLGTDDALVEAVEQAGDRAGERLWRLPLPADYREQLRSEVADLKNIGKGGEAGTIIAALFLREFVGDVPWAHLDIAGPSFSDSSDGALISKGATGFGVGTLVAYLETLG
ncbi:MAG: leucyl aminopeptidase [Actinobacteria bacterium]|nr:leucyl aminopeptidase [Actinomycetota bacterium]